MEQVIIFISTFIIIYLFYLVFVITNKNKRKRLVVGMEAIFLTKKYKLSLETLDNKKYCQLITITNSFIIAFTIAIISLVENYLLMLGLGLILLIPQIFLYYHLIGKYYQKKEGGKNAK